MSYTDFIMILPDSPVVSVLIWLVVLVVMFYLARDPAHRAINSLSRVIHNAMRMAARSVLLAEKRLIDRNKEVLLANGRESVERLIEREFHRVDAIVKRDLSGSPGMQRKLSEQIFRMDEDYAESAELPPPSPNWVDVVDAVAKIKSSSDNSVAIILKDIHKTTINQYKNAMDEYRKNMAERHSILGRMMPYWRKLTQTLGEVGKTINGLQERATVIDNKMAEYEEIRAMTDKAQRTLTSSGMTQFFISGLVLLIAIGGAIINFNLIALPMSEMVGGGSYIGPFKTSNVAALVIILVEAAMGLYLMESLRITKLFPIIGSMDDKMRIRMVWITFSILLVLAGVESALAFMRDRIASDMQALSQSLTAMESVQPIKSWIPTIGQMVMGFILPFALTFVAIPLESFVHSSRTVMGAVTVLLLRWFAFFLRLIGNVACYLGELMVYIYDLMIFPSLWIEKVLRERAARQPERQQAEGYKAELNPQEETV